jgi:S-adenosylmethionine:diacylglycerol 3-amino-3-carboxypropyl transferase
LLGTLLVPAAYDKPLRKNEDESIEEVHEARFEALNEEKASETELFFVVLVFGPSQRWPAGLFP